MQKRSDTLDGHAKPASETATDSSSVPISIPEPVLGGSAKVREETGFIVLPEKSSESCRLVQRAEPTDP